MATATLVCKQCNFENEPERVYCHNCGAKLDRSLLPPEATRREDPVIMQERVRKMVSPNRGVSLRQVKNFIASVVTASVLASILLIIKPPAGTPTVSKEAMMSAPTITEDLESLTPQPNRARKYSEDDVNAFLQYSVRGKPTSSYGVTMQFERAFVHFQEGRFSITSQQSLFGLPIYATTLRTVQIKNGAIVSQVLGGSFGSFRVPAAAMPYLEGVFAPLWNALSHDRALVAKLQAVNFHDKSVELVSTPTGTK